jgi:HlyD family secretion protein
MPPRKVATATPTREAVFQAAARLFSARGFDGVSVDDIADAAGVNKAMIYYHFPDKLALYRAVVGDMLSAVAQRVNAIAEASATPAAKIDRFIETFVRHGDERPWFPPLMMREISQGAPHLDIDTLVSIRKVFLAFGRILVEGETAGVFRKIHPVLAYTSIVGPLIMNAARERVAAQPGRESLQMLVTISHDDLIAHVQETARRMLTPSRRRLSRRSTTTRLAAFIIVTCLCACAEEAPSDRIRASGHVEATETRIAPETGGRILTLTVKEGDRVQPGQVVMTLDTRDVQLAIQRARAEQAAADAQLRLVMAGPRVEDVRHAQAQIETARAEVAAAQTELGAAEQDLSRFESLLATNSGSRKQRDDAATRRDLARDRVTQAQSRVRTAEEALARLNAGARQEEIDAARARLAATTAQIATLQKGITDATVISPVGGVVTEKLAEEGEVIPPRAPVLVVVDLDRAWADVFVPEPSVPRIRIGQPATVFTDAGGPGIPGTIGYISSKAEFTPRNVQTAEERSKLVYRVRIHVDNNDGVLKQGMPVEAEIPFDARN